jgi:AcrR family transcriptional regulator
VPPSRVELRPPEAAIFAATERLLETTRAHELSVAQILEASGISRKTFYVYFGSKYAVITRLVATVMDEMYDAIAPFLDRDPAEPRKDALRRALGAGWTVWMEHHRVLAAMHEHSHEVPELREMWLEVVERFSDGFARELDRERAEGLAPPGEDSRQLASILLWSSTQCAYVASLGIDDALPDLPTLFEPLLAVWIGALYGQV